MLTETSRRLDIPTRHEILDVQGDDKLIQDLTIQPPPEELNKTPSIFSFQRKREIEIPWGEILKDISTSGTTSVAAIRGYFEASWGIDSEATDRPSADELQALREGSKPRILRLGPVEQKDEGDTKADPAASGEPVIVRFFRTQFGDGDAVDAEAVETGIVFQHGTSGRYYLVIENPDSKLVIDDFADAESYRGAWNEKIAGVELVFATADEAKAHFTDFSELDMRPAVIERKYQELALLHGFAKDVASSVKTSTASVIQNMTLSDFNPDRIDQLQGKSIGLQMREHDAWQQLRRLKSQAADLGFVLFLDGDSLPDDAKDDTSVTVAPGKLYITYQRTARWTTQERRPIVTVPNALLFVPNIVTWGLWAASKLITVPYTKVHEKVVTAYKPADTSEDVLGKKVRSLRKDFQVFVFERTPSGFVTPEGVTLRSIMARCNSNEEFRRRCVVLLPVYEETLSGRRTITKYSIFTRPLPAIAPTMLPRLSLEESLSYRTRWQGCELGELVSSINLAPGEQRTVTVTKEFKQETTVTKSTTSIFDITQSETTDLATEMENQARSESEDATSFDAYAKAKGGWGPVTGEAGASAGRKQSLKNFNESINKMARRAAQSINQQQREEVSTSTSATTTVTSTDTTTATIRNINEGRTLNLFFYRLYNRFEAGLYLEDLQFDVLPGVEIIAGSGIYESIRFDLNHVRQMLDEFDQTQLPFDLDAKQHTKYTNRVLDSFYELLTNEYLPPKPKSDGKPTRMGNKSRAKNKTESEPERAVEQETPEQTVNRLKFAELETDAEPPNEKQSVDAQRTQRRIEGLSRWLATKDISEAPINTTDLKVIARGLYLDSMVGAIPSTERYSEEMRAQEVRMRAAEVLAKESEAVYQRAHAARLGYLHHHGAANWLTGLLPDPAKTSLLLSLKIPLSPGNWELRVDGNREATIPAKMVGRNQIPCGWDSEKKWLNADDLWSRIELFDNNTGDSVRFLR